MKAVCQMESVNPSERENFEVQTSAISELATELSSEAIHDCQQSCQSPEENRETGHTPAFDALMTEVHLLEDLDEKLKKVVDFMDASLSQGGTPSFRNFWSARSMCSELFKKNISHSVRATAWARFTELSKEAKRLRELLEEQSAFAAEQIEIAIQALENDIVNQAELGKSSESDEIPFCKTLEEKISIYASIQRELNLLNVQASRINALRKELIKTEMRVRIKNKFFQRLSLIGDKVFPRRKELIKDISQHFTADVLAFVEKNFNQERMHDSLFYLREEIKTLQGIAKKLTLNTQSFTQTRMCLSDCWDKLKTEEKERKKERLQQRVVFKQSYDRIHEVIQALASAFSTQQVSIQEAIKQIEDILTLMRTTELGREELKALKGELFAIRSQVNEKIKEEEQARATEEAERERQKRKCFEGFVEEIQTLFKETEGYDAETLMRQRDLLVEKISAAPLNKGEKQDLEKKLKPLKDVIAEKKERALLDLSEDDRQKLHQLRELLREKKERRQDIKKQLENYRKASKGSSGMDIAQALAYNAQIAEEKERLDKITSGIQDIEKKIEELESKF